jgi:hypothetical protein
VVLLVLEFSYIFMLLKAPFYASVFQKHIFGKISKSIMSRVGVTNNAGSGLDERVYLLLILTTSNYT